MTNSSKRIAVIVLAILGAASLASAQSVPIPGNAVLSDQFGTELPIGTLASSGTLVIVYSADRDATKYLLAWNALLKASVPSGTRIILAADLSAVPFFISRASITAGLVKDSPTVPILLDWDGILAKALAVRKDKVVAYAWVAGKPAAEVRGEASADGATRLANALR